MVVHISKNVIYFTTSLWVTLIQYISHFPQEQKQSSLHYPFLVSCNEKLLKIFEIC